MSFPHIQTKYTGISPDARLEAYASEKLATLEKHMGQHAGSTCHLELERLTMHHTGPVCRAEVTMYLHGKSFRAEATEATFEHAIDTVRKALDHELAHAHQKHDTLIRRGSRKLKEMLRLS
jgi:ribosomal subunit interface protein